MLSSTRSSGWVGREVYLTIEATRSTGYCRVVSSETVHCEGSSGPHPLPLYPIVTWTPSHCNTNSAPSNTYIHAYIFISKSSLSIYLLPYVAQTSSVCACACARSCSCSYSCVCICVCAHACECCRHQMIQSASDRKC